MNITRSKKADHLAVYKHDPGVELGSMKENRLVVRAGLEPATSSPTPYKN